MSWRGTAGGLAAARAGHDVVMAPSPVLYLDHRQSDSPREPPGRPGIVTLADVYAFEPVPAVSRRRRRATSSVLRSMPGPSICGCPRASTSGVPARARSRKPPGRHGRAQLERLPVAARRAVCALSQARHPFRGLRFRARFTRAGAADGDALRVTLSQQSSFGTIRFTRDGSLPGPASEPYAGPFDAASGTLLRAAAFAGELALSAQSLTVDWQALRRRTDEELAHCTGNLVLRSRTTRRPRAIARSSTWTSSIPAGSGATWISRGAPRCGRRGPAAFQLPDRPRRGRNPPRRRADHARRARVPRRRLHRRAAARLPLAAANASDGVMVIGPVHIAPQAGRGNLCLRFARTRIDPIWTLAWVALGDDPMSDSCC